MEKKRSLSKHQDEDGTSTKNLSLLAKKAGITEKDLPLLEQALTHRSYIHEVGGESNERLEFLGDSVLSLVISEYLYTRFPQKTEGELSKWRSSLVNSRTLAQIAASLNLGELLYLGAGEEKTGGRKRASLLADAMEAIIAVAYLTKGLQNARSFIIPLWQPYIEALLTEEKPLDPKTMLQEVLQQRHGELPTYKLMNVEGPDHQRLYTMAVYSRDRKIGVGRGTSKKEAAKKAAEQGLLSLEKPDFCTILKNRKN